MKLLFEPWPWYIAGPLIGLMIPLLLILGNKSFGISSSFRHICAACIPGNISFFKYNWKSEIWNLVFVGGVIIGSFIAGFIFSNPNPVDINPDTKTNLLNLGIQNFEGLLPKDLFSFNALFTVKGFLFIVVGGFLVGFGTRYANGCTSGHTIMGISNLQLPSLIATICFFIGGLITTWIFLPYLLKL
ncbi:MAG: YeeE/YedE family protein [Sphingobacteriaceae bacterium]|nr:YeeE/YedE family protein [Sphingobacteriaceae bacterium]